MTRFRKSSEPRKWMNELDSLQGSPERIFNVVRKVKPKFRWRLQFISNARTIQCSSKEVVCMEGNQPTRGYMCSVAELKGQS